jgi:hypothetical protein
VVYGTIRIDIGFRAGVMVEDRVIVEIGLLIKLQRGPDQGRHYPYRQWLGRRVSRQAARTPRGRVKLRDCTVLSV